MHICIFEDINHANLEPLSRSRPVYELVCGISTLREKIIRYFPKAKVSLHCRKYLQPLLEVDYPQVSINKIDSDSCLFINGRLLTNENLGKIFNVKNDEDCVFMSGDTIAAVQISGERLKTLSNNFPDVFSKENFIGLPIKDVGLEYVNYIWDLINRNGEEIKRDFKCLVGKSKNSKKKTKKKIHEGVHFINKKDVYIGSGTEIKPGCVIDASKGPVYIDRNVLIYPNAVIEGPAYIGEGSKIKSGATIYENVSIGKVCKIAGEVEDMIMLPYSNKQHAGFIGHSYLGSWVNLGADTNCSDLKNNYKTVRAMVNGLEVDSDSQFLGLIMGDHSKTAINTMFNTGTVAGFSCNIFGAGFPPKEIPSFSWGGGDEMNVYLVENSIETARSVFKRRDKTFSESDEQLFRDIFEKSKNERSKKGY